MTQNGRKLSDAYRVLGRKIVSGLLCRPVKPKDTP